MGEKETNFDANKSKKGINIKFYEPNMPSKFIYICVCVGYKNLNKALAPHVISMADESIAKPRRPHACTVRPHQWHIAIGGPTVEKKLRRGVNPDMTEGVVVAPMFNASHQTSWLHLCREDP